MLFTLVIAAFTSVEDGKLVLPLTKSALIEPIMCIVIANLAVMCFFGVACLLYPAIFMGHIFGASIGLAIGIDGMLVMYSYLRRPLKDNESKREAYIESFSTGATAVTFTSISTAIAFLATACSVFEMAIEIGVCCAIAVFFNWLYTVLFFGAVYAYLDLPPKTASFISRGFFEGPVSSMVSSTAGKVLIFAIAIGLVIGGGASFDRIQKEAGFEPIFDTEAANILEWQYSAYRHFGDAYTWNVTLVLTSPEIEYYDTTSQQRIGSAIAAVGASKYVDAGSVDSWLGAFKATLTSPPDNGFQFYDALRTWLASPSGRRYVDDVELVEDAACSSTCIVASRFRFTQSAAQWGDAFPVYVAAIDVTAPFEEDLGARLFADEYIIYELDEYNKLGAQVAVAVGTVGIALALLLFFHPLVALAAAASIFCIELMTVPFILIGGIRIGPAVVFSAGAAFGMASDALVHMIHAWQDAKASGHPTPVTAALGLVGHPLLFSGLSTSGMFASFMPLIYKPIASIQMAYTLSFIFLAFVGVQLFFGLLVVPAVLHTLTPASKDAAMV